MKKRETKSRPLPASPVKPALIVAIGASAGGLEAVTELLKNLSPTTGMAFVYVQHLDPTHKSMLSSILSNVTKMKVQEAKNMMHIDPDNFYIIPPDKDIVILDGTLKLERRPSKPNIHMPINQFFTSLAEKHKDTAIGVVLSGNASDGALGLKAIKISGGVTFAQDETAKFQSMPKSAIAEGGVDLVLSPKNIAKELERLSVNKEVLNPVVADDEIEESNDEDLFNIIQLLKKSTGVDFGHYKKSTIRRRIIRRMVLYRLTGLKEYAQYLRQHTVEVNILYQDLLINVTAFFRHPNAMEYLKKVLFPRILKTKGHNEPIRIWVPACSTGEEAYSIAMVLMESLGNRVSNFSIQLFATDLSETAIAKARLGLYTKNDLADVSPKRLQKFFTRTDGSYRIIKSIRDLCVFAPHNIFKDPPFSRLDLISCCNLLIYLDITLQKKVMTTFHYALNENGYLILGKSETIGTSGNLFSAIDKKLKIYARKKDTVARAVFDMSSRIPSTDKSKVVVNKKLHKEVKPLALEKKIDTILLERYVPASVVVNKEMDILQFRGSTGMFLEPAPGKASLNLIKMARAGLGFELRNAIHKVIETGETFKKSNIEIKYKNNSHHVSIEITPLENEYDEQYFLIVFNEMPKTIEQNRTVSSRDKKVKTLEKELMAAREDMRSILEEQEAVNEELQSANEEVVSSNEELQSINEELETSKEEVESTNEELLTVNQELHIRNDQLAEANEFTEAVIGTVSEALIILDEHLRVKTANRSFYKLFQTNEDNIEGQLIYELGNAQWKIPRLRELLEDIIPRNEQFHGFEVKSIFPKIGERTFALNARKIIQGTNRQQLILLAMEDITEQAEKAQLIAEREEWLRTMAENMPVMIWVSDINKQHIFFNTTWFDYTGRNKEQEWGMGWTAGIYPEDKDRMLQVINSSFQQQIPFKEEYRLRNKGGEYKWVLTMGKPNFDYKANFTGFIGITSEIHDQHLINEELEQQVKMRTKSLQETNVDLERSNEELKQFAYVASHDLQEPLRKIITFCNKLDGEKPSPQEIEKMIKKISTNAQQMRVLITDLLNFSKVSGKENQFVKTDLNEIVDDVLKDFDESIKEKKATITVETLPVINAVPIEITSLFHNLINNAIKFASPQRTLKIAITAKQMADSEVKKHPALKVPGRYVDITVEDNGIGFAPEYAEQIFVIFQRLNIDKKQYPGTGIGLALCKKIVNYHGGIIYVQSEENKGTAFHVVLPVNRTTEN